VKAIKLENCLTAQYVKDDAGKFLNYTDEDKIPRDSRTPTFATCVLFIDNARWEGVPFILRAGKALNERKSEIRVQFRKSPGSALLFPNMNLKPGQEPVARNELVIRVQPNEAVYMKINVKQPGLDGKPVTSELDLSYNSRYPELFKELPEAYTRLILQTLRGDSSSFVRDDELRIAWQIFSPLLDEIDAGKNTLVKYKAGSRGPIEHDELAKKFGYVPGEYQWKPPSAKC
jgi:glucose-6-phosphate 1-dehydrogenase